MGKRWNVPYKKVVLEYADLCGRDVRSYREFGVSKSTLYAWRKAFRENGAAGLIPKKPVAYHRPRALPCETVEKILHLRKSYCLGPSESPATWHVIMASRPLVQACTGDPSSRL